MVTSGTTIIAFPCWKPICWMTVPPMFPKYQHEDVNPPRPRGDGVEYTLPREPATNALEYTPPIPIIRRGESEARVGHRYCFRMGNAIKVTDTGDEDGGKPEIGGLPKNDIHLVQGAV